MTSARNIVAVLTALLACAILAGPAEAETFTFTVNDTGDLGDTSPGDTICDSNVNQTGAQCTLRAAVQETNGLNDIGPFHVINLPAGTYTLTGPVLAVTWNLNLVGAGARSTIIEQSTADRVFRLTNDTNISGVTIRNGTANFNNGSFGGNVLAEFSTVSIVNSTITGGNGNSGGGLSNQGGSMTVRNSTIAGNHAVTGGGDGGAIQNGNTAGAVPDIASLVLENTTISGNDARLAGGIISGGNAGNSIKIDSSTIASNTSGDRGGGGGLLMGAGTATVENSIVANNTSTAAGEPNCTPNPAAITSLGFNIESGSECGFDSTSDRQNTNPLLGALQNAGGPTDTRPLLAGSPAINAGSITACPATDQRGVVRPQGARCDIGAFEAVVAQAAPDTVIVSGPSLVTRDRTPTFTFSSSAPGTTFECSLDNGAFAPCSSPFTLPNLSAGTHTLEVRARDAQGNVDPTPAGFTFAIPAQLSDLPAPTIGKTVNAEPVSGDVTVAVPAGASAAGSARAAQKGLKFIPLREARQLPVGTFFNTKKGRVRLQTATTRRGQRQSGVFFGGLFQTLQARRGSSKGIFELRLKGSSFKSCRAAGRGKKASAARSKRRIRRLRGNAKGRFRTRGRYSAATVRGTIWDVSDRCDGTLTKVSRGRVSVRDLRKRKNILLRAGKSYLARPG